MAAEVGAIRPPSDHHRLVDTDSEADIYDDHAPNFDLQGASRSSSALSGVLPLGNIQNISRKQSLDTITVALSNFHIHTVSSKENIQDLELGKGRARSRRPQLDKNTFDAPLIDLKPDQGLCDNQVEQPTPILSVEAPTAEDFEIYNPVAFEARRLPSNQEQLSKHQAGQFEWVLSIPTNSSAKGTRSLSFSHEDPGHPDETKRLFFGCNLVLRRTQSGGAMSKNGNSANIYTLLATQLEGDEMPISSITQFNPVEETENMSITAVVEPDTTIIGLSEPAAGETGVRRMSDSSIGVKNDNIFDEITSLPPANPTSRIEDSVEALDKLEEELEAVTEVAGLSRVRSPRESKVSTKTASRTSTQSGSLPRSNATKRPTTTINASRARTLERNSSVRKSTSLAISIEEEKPGTRADRRKSTIVQRPTSLIPPKAPAKSSKLPTVSTFELPGEAVARRLKQQREARRSQILTPEQVAAAAAAYSPSKPHVKSTKPPTRPTFELPGDAISRKKREEREAKLRAQEEEERKRREFKARPIRASIVPNSYPRETITSKARRGKAASQAEEEAAVAAAAPTPVAKKRQSMTISASFLSRPTHASSSTSSHLSATFPTRGRASVSGSRASGAHISRATSTASTASIQGGSSVGKRSTISAEDIVQQKQRGREILDRDKSMMSERGREKREREEATIRARREAAEQSRKLSRKWAEKHARERAARTEVARVECC